MHRHAVFLLVFSSMLATIVRAAPPTIDFARDVQPLLVRSCIRCHGPKLQESNYRLDVRRAALAAADRGDAPIVPGDADASPLFHFVSHTDPDGTIMPPEDEGEPLDAEQVRILRDWINQGAVWPDDLAGVHAPISAIETDHWSFQPLKRPAIPHHLNGIADKWCANPIDAFVLERLRESSLEPWPKADRRTLARRLYLVMVGLPPPTELVDRFVADPSPAAYERLIDNVMGNPHVGERWSRHWLDVVRFGETHGFETNRERPNAFPYRDYVIAALNEDKPYDQFVREQICGDALDVDAATGFLVGGPYDLVKSPDINLTLMQRQDELADIVNTTGTTFLGLTLGCARCHHHKFDPVLQRDYYAVQAVFAGVNHGERAIRQPETAAVLERIAVLEQESTAKNQTLDTLRAKAKELATAALAASGRRPAVNARLNEENFEPVTARYVRFTIHATNSSEPCIDELEIYATDGSNMALLATGAVATASGTLPGYAIHQLDHINDGAHGNDHSWISNTLGSGWVQIELPEPATIDRILWGRDRGQRFTDRVATDYVIEAALEPDDWQVVSSSADRDAFAAGQAQQAAISYLPTAEAEQARALAARIAAIEQRIQQLSGTFQQAWIGTFSQPEWTHRLYRGDPQAKREIVAPDTLSVFGSLDMQIDEPEQARRRRFADWVVRKNNPLTARVIVNRLWHYHFGTGIVATPSDFGVNGARPTHPELLDWLAAELIDNDWSLKHVHRLILTSSTFCQSSRPRLAALRADASSRLLWRFPPRRLEAETIRDSILAASGSLNCTMGGPGFSAFDVQPENVYHYFPRKTWGPRQWRRMVYMTKVRQEQDSVFGNFDCPDGNQTIPDRSRSTTPLQALNLFNSPFVIQQSNLLAVRLRAEAGDHVGHQVTRAFRLLHSRDPDEYESRGAKRFVSEYGLEPFCRAMLNSNEFLFVF